jgi:hypothetical protein
VAVFRVSPGPQHKEAVVADDRNQRGPQDRARINVHEDYELRYWTRAFGVSADELRQAVQAVGVMRDDVARHLGKA